MVHFPSAVSSSHVRRTCRPTLVLMSDACYRKLTSYLGTGQPCVNHNVVTCQYPVTLGLHIDSNLLLPVDFRKANTYSSVSPTFTPRIDVLSYSSAKDGSVLISGSPAGAFIACCCFN